MGECRSAGRRGNVILSKKYITNYFNPCCARPSNARFVIFCIFTVADAARRHGLRIACGCVPRRYARSVAPPLVKKSRSVRLFAYKCAHNASLSLPTFCRFKRLGLSHETNIRIQKIPQDIPCGIFTFTQPKSLFKNKIPPCAIAATTLVLTARCSGRNSDTLFFCRRSPRAASSPSFFTLRTLGGVRRQSKENSVCPARDL